MSKLKQLTEQREDLYKQIVQLREKNKDVEIWTKEDDVLWDKLNSDEAQVSRSIEREEQSSRLEERMDARRAVKEGDVDLTRDAKVRQDLIERGHITERETNHSVRDENQCLRAWALTQRGEDVPQDCEEALQRQKFNPHKQDLTFRLFNGDYNEFRNQLRGGRPEYRAQSTGATAGGEYIPEGFVRNLEIAMLDFSGMRQVAQVMRTSEGNDMPWPTTDDTSNVGAILAENTQVSEQDVTTGAVVFEAYKYTSSLVRVSFELIQDSAFDMSSVLARLLGERIGRITNQHFTTGTGTSQPRGAITAGTVFTTAVDTFDADDLISIKYALDPAYRASPSAAFMMHDTIQGEVRKFKDSNGQYLWQPSLIAGQPATFDGFRVISNQDMDSGTGPTYTTGEELAAFADWSKYIIRDVGTVRLRRLVERYADFDQEGFVAFSRHDGDSIQDGAIRVARVG